MCENCTTTPPPPPPRHRRRHPPFSPAVPSIFTPSGNGVRLSPRARDLPRRRTGFSADFVRRRNHTTHRRNQGLCGAVRKRESRSNRIRKVRRSPTEIPARGLLVVAQSNFFFFFIYIFLNFRKATDCDVEIPSFLLCFFFFFFSRRVSGK